MIIIIIISIIIIINIIIIIIIINIITIIITLGKHVLLAGFRGGWRTQNDIANNNWTNYEPTYIYIYI